MADKDTGFRVSPLVAANLQGFLDALECHSLQKSFLADWAQAYYTRIQPDAAEVGKHINDTSKPAIATLRNKLAALPEWTAPAISKAFFQTLEEHRIKMPLLAMPVRLLTNGHARGPDVAAMLALHKREVALMRLARA